MNTFRVLIGTAALAGLMGFLACSTRPKSADVTDSINSAFKQAGLKDVSVSEDRDKGVVTLKGSVVDAADKMNAGNLAKSIAGGLVVANEIAVLPPGEESTAKNISSDLDGGIKKNLDAALIQHGLKDNVDYDVKNGVVTLKGEVRSETTRAAAQQIAANVPNVQQVVNKLDVKDQRATSTSN
jgi:hyperosmotically inducible protein